MEGATNILEEPINSAERLNYLIKSPLSIFQFGKFEGSKFCIIDQILMYST